MGKTWTSEQRKRHGKRKTRNHRTRAKFKQKNPGVRLRTLEVDIRDFQDVKGSTAVPLHVTKVPKSDVVADAKVRQLGIGKTEKQLRREARRREPPVSQPPREPPKPKPTISSPVETPLAEEALAVNSNNLRGIGCDRYERYTEMTNDQLQAEVDFYKKQLRFITSTSRIFRDLGDLETAQRIRDSKDDYLQGELNALLLYVQRFR